ncbi:MAG: ATP-binding protein, partial [Lachnospiraceae bacterium]|nr:ATP-binding protein [Lachnospiraceae bacterium]
VEGKTIGVDEVPNVPIKNFIAPRGIDFTNHTYTIMDGRYYTVLYIKGNGYPSKVRAGWLSTLINAGEGVDVDVFLKKENKSKVIDKVAQKIRLNRTKLKDMQDTSTDYEELTNSIQAGYYIKQGIANYNEDLFYMSVFITVSAKTKKELLWRKQRVIDTLKAVDICVSEGKFQQEEAFKSVMPFLSVSPVLDKKSKRNVLTSGAASSYMFTSFEMSDDTGVLLGVNQHNNSLCIVDLFNTKKNKNANLNLIGTSGAGKTFTMQLLALRMRMRGIQSFILAPIKGHEFKRACKKIDGSFIRIAPGSPHCINVMEIRQTISPEMELIDGIDYRESDSLLAGKIQQLMIFFTLLIPDITNEEEQLLDEALIKTYKDFGITHKNKSLYVNGDKKKFKKMPVLGDLHKKLKDNPRTERLAIILSRFVTGSAQSFNRQTNVDLSNKYIVIDLSELKGKLLPVGMMIALDYVWDNIKMDRIKKKAVFIDEIWQLVGASANSLAADFCLNIFKTIRGYGGAAIAATQDLSDFFGLEDGKYGRAIINNSQNKIILNLEHDEAQYVRDVLKLTRTEIHAITSFGRGEALVCSSANKIPIVIKASEEEHESITTDRAELEAILQKHKAKE